MKSRMPERGRFLPFAVFAAAAILFAAGVTPASAQVLRSYTYTLGILGGVGGALDADVDPGLAQPSLMFEAAIVTEARTLVGVRVGRLKIDGDEGFEQFIDAELDYINIAGEYRFSQSYYDYGVYIGLGYYKLEGDLRTGGSEDEGDLGAVIGFTGDFDVTRHVSIIGDIAVHYAWIDTASIYTAANFGVGIHW